MSLASWTALAGDPSPPEFGVWGQEGELNPAPCEERGLSEHPTPSPAAGPPGGSSRRLGLFLCLAGFPSTSVPGRAV